nr:RluA family pseudouridine synthase [uncultured Cellulosilyticum sp.]
MRREIQYKIDTTYEGQSIGMFLKAKEYSRGILIELKKTKTGIRKNGVWAGVNEIIKAGDVLDICLTEESSSENIVPKQYDLDILYEDEDILVLNKPHDTPIHPSINNYDNTLANGVVYYYKDQEKPYVFRCINRLDRDTTGVTIIAKNMLSASILSNRMQARGLTRTYIAFVEGLVEEEGIIDLPIGRMEGTIIKRQVDEKDGKRAVTHYRRLEVIHVEGQLVSVVALRLETGRTHQIRVHMSHIGHPLLGDFLYNENNHMLTRQGLHAAEIGFYHPITGAYMNIVAPLPEDMERLLQNSGEKVKKSEELAIKLRKMMWH